MAILSNFMPRYHCNRPCSAVRRTLETLFFLVEIIASDTHQYEYLNYVPCGQQSSAVHSYSFQQAETYAQHI